MSCSPGLHARRENGLSEVQPQEDRMVRASTNGARYVCGAAMLAATLACATTILAQKSKRPKTRPQTPAVAATGAAPVPFRAGETLEYRVLYSKYAGNPARIETAVVEQRRFFGHLAWHF